MQATYQLRVETNHDGRAGLEAIGANLVQGLVYLPMPSGVEVTEVSLVGEDASRDEPVGGWDLVENLRGELRETVRQALDVDREDDGVAARLITGAKIAAYSLALRAIGG